MARIGADTGTDAGTEDTTDTTSDDDAGADTSVEDRTRDIIDTGEQDTNITAPEPDQPARGGGGTEPDPEPDPTPEPDQPALGGGETDTTPTDDAGADTNVGDKQQQVEEGAAVADPEPNPDPETIIETPTAPEDQGIESQEGEFSEQAQQFEQQYVSQRERIGEEDVRVTVEDGELQLGYTQSGISAATAQQLRERETTRPGDVSVENDTVFLQLGATGELGRSLQMDESVALANRQRAKQLGEIDVGYDDEVIATANREISRERGNVSDERQEQFGDADVSFGTNALTDEEAQREASEEYQQAVESATGEGGIFGESLIAEGLEYAGYDQTAETVEETGRDFLGGVGAILNPAAVAVTATETAEYGIYGAQQYAEGDFEDFVGESQEAGVNRARAFADYIGENPAEAVGMGAGALVGSAAVMSAAGRISPRAGMATRYAIQPGEEIAGSAGFRATRAIGGEASAQRYFPNREPLIFSEEAAIRGLRGASSRVRNVRNIDTELAGSPRQRDIVERFRPTGGTGEFESGIATESQVAGAQSEPLGSRGDEVLNRLYGGGKTQTTTTTSPEPRRGVSELLASERGQAQIGRQIGRTETESEVRLTDDRVSDNLYQQAVSRQVQAEYGARQGTIDDPDFRYETQRRTERAQESEVRTEAETDVTRPRMRLETFINERADTEPFEIEGVDTDVGQDTGFDALSEFETEFEQEAEQETETELESLFETEFKQEAEQETETELESLFETEFETEFEQETEQELELETETEAETRREVFGPPDFESGGGDDIAGLFAADRGERVTDFIDPLTGERLE